MRIWLIRVEVIDLDTIVAKVCDRGVILRDTLVEREVGRET